MIRKLIFPVLILASCEFNDPDIHYVYHSPVNLNDDLSISSLEAEGIDQSSIETLTDLIVNDTYKRIHGLLILKNGNLVYENYFNGYQETVLQNNYSVAKSFTSILTGIALEKGFIKSLDVPALSLLPGYDELLNKDPRKNNITIRHLLTMNSGLDCNDWIPSSPGEAQMQKKNDWIRYTFDLPIAFDPGTHPSYCTGNPVALGRIIENTSGMTLEGYANQYLFHPLGITNYKWYRMPDGHDSGGGLFYLRPRDMAKIGLLMLNKGSWKNERILSAQWVEESTRKQVDLNNLGYGYLWWTFQINQNNQKVESYFAWGNGGQFIFIIPEKQMAVVITGGNFESNFGLQAFKIIGDHIMPALK